MEDVNRRLQRVLTHIDLLQQELDGQRPAPDQRRELLRLHRLADELDAQLGESAHDDGAGPGSYSMPSSDLPSAQSPRPRNTTQDPLRPDDEVDRAPVGRPASTSDALSAKDTVFSWLLVGGTILTGGLIAANQVDDRDLALLGMIGAGGLAPILVGVGTYKGSVLRKCGSSSPKALSPSERRWSLVGAVAAALVTNIIVMSLAPSGLL